MVSNPLMKLLKNDSTEKSKSKKTVMSAISKGLLEFTALKEVARALSSLLSLFIVFPLQIALFYLFVNGFIVEGLIFSVAYAFIVIFAFYKILTKSLFRSKKLKH
jgi:ribonucleotide reductase beta subunit family protein with ferritin-like domain